MKKIASHYKISFLLIMVAGMVTFGCKKLTFEDALPVVSMQSINMIGTDSVEITGKVDAIGASDIEYEGFCYGTDAMPEIRENQVFTESGTTIFMRHVLVKQDSTYYFRFFAANGTSYSLSTPMKFTVPHAKPVIAPCTLTDKRVVTGGNPHSVSSAFEGRDISGGSNNWIVDVSLNDAQLTLSFPQKPTNGKYITGAKVSVEYTPFDRYLMTPGDTVYVKENADKSTSYSFCSLHFMVNSFRAEASGKFTATQ
jgi:hypothetical protein